MDRRKSLGHSLQENARRNSPTGPTRRRSIAISMATPELNFNDDEAERAASRLESNAITPTPPSNRRSITLGAVTKMSAPQIADGIAECIRLNTQNKINMKNAFSLDMIDFMSYMVRNKDDTVSTLQMASQTLDVSAKIYSLRVDSLHQDTLKMIGTLHPQNDANPDTDNVADDNTTQVQDRAKKKTKKKSNPKILTTIEDLMGDDGCVKLEPPMFGDTDCQTSDMLYQAMLPQHCMGIRLHVYNDVLLDNVKNNNVMEKESLIQWPPIRLNENGVIAHMFADFEFLNFTAEVDDSTQLVGPSTSINDEFAFNLDASLPLDNSIPKANNFFDMDNANEEDYHGQHAEIDVLGELIENVPRKNLEYSVLYDIVDIKWAGPSHWTIKNIRKDPSVNKVVDACRQDPSIRRKKLAPLVYNDQSIGECNQKYIISKKATGKLKPKTAKNSWSEEKITLPIENYVDTQKPICQYFLRPDDILKFTKTCDMDNSTILPDDQNDQYDYGNHNDTINYCPNIQDNDIQDDEVHNDDAFDTGAHQDGFILDNLVEAPKLTQKIFISYSQRAKKLDMRQLKNCVWKSLASENEVEPENTHSLNNAGNIAMTVTDQKNFSTVCIGLPDQLSANDAEELSASVAFVSLLHLANEKCLKISNTNEFSDLIIAQDSSQ